MKCSLLTNHVCIHTTGEYRLCCISQEQSKIQNVNNTKPIEWLTSDYVKSIVNQFDKDQWPDSCRQCRLSEEAGQASKRQLSNLLYHGDGIKYIDIRLGNTCNLRCQTCWPVSSSKIAKDMILLKDNSPWKVLPLNFKSNSNWQDNIEVLDSLINDGLEEIYITGGEPFLAKQLVFIINKLSKTTKIRFNTNGTIYNQEAAEALNAFTNVQIDVSIDAYGEKNEYIRADSVWGDIDRNIDRFKDIAKVTITPTVSVYNVLYLKELQNYCDSKDVEYKLNDLYGPSYMSISNAPDSMKQYIDGFTHLINIPSDRAEQLKFIDYVKQTDTIRGLDIKQSLPEVARFYEIT